MRPMGSPLSTEQHGGEGVERVGCWEGDGGGAREQRQLMGTESLKMVAVLAKQVFSFSFLNVFP